MGLISRFGEWLDRLTEKKVTESEIDNYLQQINNRISLLYQDLNRLSTNIVDPTPSIEKIREDHLKMRDELNAIKALMKIGGLRPPGPAMRQNFDGSEPWKR